jgi:hypothetical protein
MRPRDNPFSAQRLLEVRYRLSGTTWDDLLARLAALGWRASIVGPHGRGKTTLLEDLAERLAARGWRVRAATLRRGDRRLGAVRAAELFDGLTRGDLLLVDGAEQLNRFFWWLLRRRSLAAGGLVVTSHRAGLLPTLYECRTTPELLATIVRDLADSSPEVAPEDLFARHEGNLRTALRELYDRRAASAV